MISFKKILSAFNPFTVNKKFNKVLSPDNPNEIFGDVTEIFGGHGNFQGYVSNETLNAFIGKVVDNMQPKTIPNGIHATASVISAQKERMQIKSGTTDICKLILQVNVVSDKGETWEAVLEDMIPSNQIPVFQPGYSFGVKYDPNDKLNICREDATQVDQPDLSKFL